MNIEIFIALAGIALSVATFIVGRLTSAKNDGKQNGAIMSELGYLKSGTDDIKRRLDKQDEHYLETISRLTAVEASAKQAHKRIDTLERDSKRGED